MINFVLLGIEPAPALNRLLRSYRSFMELTLRFKALYK